MRPFWSKAVGAMLAQGDFLPECHVPEFGEGFGRQGGEEELAVRETDLIVVTQSCDLENEKVPLVALCPIHSLDAFEEANPTYKGKGRWESVRQGRVAGLHMLASPEAPNDNRAALIVDFGQIHSLPPAYVKRRATELGARWRLESPFLEHFSQALARYFMRVGLPSSIPAFK